MTLEGLAPEAKLALSMIILAIQDLKIENMFKDVGSMPLIRGLLVITKSSKVKKQDVISALNYIYKSKPNELYSFDNCCSYVQIDASVLKKIITKYLNDPKVASYKYFIKWRGHEDSKKERE